MAGEFACIAKKRETTGTRGVEKDYSRTPFNHEVFAYCSGRCFRHAFHGGGRRSQENDFCGKKAALLEKYDVNKDGKLDSEEKAKMKEDLKKQREEERAKRHASRKAD